MFKHDATKLYIVKIALEHSVKLYHNLLVKHTYVDLVNDAYIDKLLLFILKLILFLKNIT